MTFEITCWRCGRKSDLILLTPRAPWLMGAFHCETCGACQHLKIMSEVGYNTTLLPDIVIEHEMNAGRIYFEVEHETP